MKYKATHVVCITVKWDRAEEEEAEKFLDWLWVNKIYSEVGKGGGSIFRNTKFYHPEDAEKIIKYLKERGRNNQLLKQ